MEAILAAADSKESKARAEALVTLLDRLEQGLDTSRHLDHLCAVLAVNIPENNVKACVTACAVAEAVASQQGKNMAPHVQTLCAPLLDVLGNAKPMAREKAADALFALMAGVGAGPVMALLLDKGLAHKSWRVREGVLCAYSRQAAELGPQSCVCMDLLLGPASTALGAAEPDLRRGAADALARLGMQVGMAAVAGKVTVKGARPAQVKTVTDRYQELTGEEVGSNAPPSPPPVVATGAPGKRGPPSSRAQAQHVEEVAREEEARPAVALGGKAQGRALARGGAASMADPAPSPVYTPTPSAAGQSAVALATEAMSDEEIAEHPSMVTLTHLHSGPWWEPGLPGSGGTFREEVGRARPLPLPSPRDLPRVLDDFAATCSTTTAEWKDRGAALEKLRGLIAGGIANVEGFQQHVGRLRDPLCTQVQDLRSSICKQACLAATELSAVLGQTHWFEPLADALVETLSKQTCVSIAVIATSAHGALSAILHNTRVGWPRVIAKLTAGVRTRSAILRAKCSEYLLLIIRGWAPSCLDRHGDDITSALFSLLTDADPTARQCARLAYWSFISNFPGREASLLARLDTNAQRLLSEDLPVARDDAMAWVRTPVLTVHSAGAPLVAPLPSFQPQQAQAQAQPALSHRVASAKPAPAAAPPPAPAPTTAPGRQVGGGGGRTGGGGLGATTTAGQQQQQQLGATRGAPSKSAAAPPSRAPAPTSAEAGYGSDGGEERGVGGPTGVASAYANYSYAPSGANLTVRGGGVASAPPAPSLPASNAGTPTRPAPRPLVAPIRPSGPSQGALYSDSSTMEAALAPLEPLSAQASRELISAAVSRLAAGDADSKGVRDRAADFLNAGVRAKAVDARSVVRAYGSGERVPASVSVPASSISAAHASMASARAGGVGGGGPGNVSYPPLTSPTAQLESHGIKAMLGALNKGRLQRGIRACILSTHEFVVMDGLALLSTLLDTHADAFSLVVLNFGHACLGQGVAVGADNTLKFAGAALPVVLTQLSALTLAPVYARLLLRGPDADTLEGSATSAAAAAGLFSDSFRSLFAAVLHCTSGATERVCTAGKRALACMRRAFPVPCLMAVTLSTLLTDATPRVQMVALHLVRDMLNDAGGAEYFANEARTQRLLSRVSDMLLSLSRGGGAGGASDARAPSSPFYGLAELVDELIGALLSTARVPTLTALARLSPDQLRTLTLVADAEYGGGGTNPGLGEAVFKAKAAAGAGAKEAAAYTLSAHVPPTLPPNTYGGGVATGPPLAGGSPPLVRLAGGGTGVPAGAPTAVLPRAQGSVHVAAAPAAYPPLQAAPPLPVQLRGVVPAPAPAPAPPASPAPPPRGSASVQGEVPFPPGFPHTIPLTRANLELVLDTLASPDKGKQLRALHYFGRAVDVTPSGGQGGGSGRPTAPPPHPSPTSAMLVLPAVHAADAIWLSLLDRVVSAVLNCVPLPGTPHHSGGGLPPGLSPPGGPGGPSADALTLTQTALSVLRKMFRNCPAYVCGKSGTVLGCLLSTLRSAPRDVATVVERSLEEVVDRLPAELALTHLVASLCEGDPLEGSQAAPVSACLRVLTRLVHALPPPTLAGELAKGRLMEAVRKAFLSTSTDVRRCVVSLLVDVHGALRGSPGAFGRYTDAYLTEPQARLLAIYIDKANAGGEGHAA